jgi:hypothetical protein
MKRSKPDPEEEEFSGFSIPGVRRASFVPSSSSVIPGVRRVVFTAPVQAAPRKSAPRSFIRKFIQSAEDTLLRQEEGEFLSNSAVQHILRQNYNNIGAVTPEHVRAVTEYVNQLGYDEFERFINFGRHLRAKLFSKLYADSIVQWLRDFSTLEKFVYVIFVPHSERVEIMNAAISDKSYRKLSPEFFLVHL